MVILLLVVPHRKYETQKGGGVNPPEMNIGGRRGETRAPRSDGPINA